MSLLPLAMASLLLGCATTTDLEDRVADLEGRLLEQEARLLEQEQALATLQSQASTCDADGVRVVRESATVSVDTAEELVQALHDLDQVRIASGATYTLQVAPGTLTFTEALTFSHPTGHRIRIHGAGPDLTTLYFPNSTGVVVEGASALGYLGDLSILGEGGDFTGLKVSGSSNLEVGPLHVEGFGAAGIWVDQNSALVSDGSGDIVVQHCGHGVTARESSFVSLPYAEASDNAMTGFDALYGSVLLVPGSRAYRNAWHGYSAYYGCWLSAGDAVEEDAGNYGYFAAKGSYIDAEYSRASGDEISGYVSYYGSFISATGATSETHTGGYGFDSTMFSGLVANEATVSENAIADYVSAANGYVWAYPTDASATAVSKEQDLDDLIYGLDAP